MLINGVHGIVVNEMHEILHLQKGYFKGKWTVFVLFIPLIAFVLTLAYLLVVEGRLGAIQNGSGTSVLGGQVEK